MISNKTKHLLKHTKDKIIDKNKKKISKHHVISSNPSSPINEDTLQQQNTKFYDKITENNVFKQRNEVLTTYKFENLNLSEHILKGIKKLGHEYMMKIQEKAIPEALNGKNILGAAKTGSGKTLAFLIPAIETLHRVNFRPINGTGVLIISPTRELAMQINEVSEELMKETGQTKGIVMGGTKIQKEKHQLSKGVNLLIGTPGRLYDHMKNTKEFKWRNLFCLIMDEADKLLENGFEKELTEILKLLPKERQTLLFSATINPEVRNLVKLSFETEPVYIGIEDGTVMATREGLMQGYIVVPVEDRLQVLFAFLKKNIKRKIIVFFATNASVSFHYDLFSLIELPVYSIAGKLKQSARNKALKKFKLQNKGCILLATNVMARGLDIPNVEWIVQYDVPDDVEEYIHRVGRTARGDSGKGKSLLFLMPNEMPFFTLLKESNIPIKKYKYENMLQSKIQAKIEDIISTNYFIGKSAKKGFKEFVMRYQYHPLKNEFKIKKLDMLKVSKAFGFTDLPLVNLKF